MTATNRKVRWYPHPDVQGYWTTLDDRWKGALHPDGRVTLADTTRRARFADTGASWTRLQDWDLAADVIQALT